MNVTPQDQAAGFKEIRIAMLDGKFEVVCVSAPKPEKLIALMSQQMSAKTLYEFVGVVTGKNLEFILQISPESFSQIFITVCGLIGAENLGRQAALQAGLGMIQKASDSEI